ncbi:MAG: BMP family ABC transporter substrate-binding protein [Chloroflexi bacterium]|nr:BMP family ABC transporter substrate-binding protein [Chloroflexota bacterium]
MKRAVALTAVAALVFVGLSAAQRTVAQEEFVVGYVLVGPQNDRGWSQAHFEASQYVEKTIPGVKSIVVDKVNPADRPNVTLEQVVENMIEQGARVIFTASDEFGAETLAVAERFPEVVFIHVSGSAVLEGKAPKNVGNVMGKMEFMKMVAGCAAALKTQTNSIAYLGPLINDETRRLVVSTYLGARYCYEKYRGLDPANLKFEVKWIGFWFHIPGVTADPTAVANEFFNGGADVLISGIDTTEGIVVANQRAERGEKVFAIPYDYSGACEVAPKICLGVPYFNWGPSYMRIVKSVMDGTWQSSWDWDGPNWENVNDLDTSAVGYIFGDALTDAEKETLNAFKKGLGDGSINLFVGPLNYQDGTPFLAEGEIATDKQIWYMPQLIEGIIGASKAD